MCFLKFRCLNICALVLVLGVFAPHYAQAQFFGAKASEQSASQLPDIVSLVERHADSVVNISSTTKPDQKGSPFGEMPSPFGGTPFEDMFREFFENMPQKPMRPSQSLGSGVIISADGYVVTNNHVVQQADDILVRLNDESEYQAELIGADSKNDLALLKINTDKVLPHTNLGDSDSVRVGEWVVAIGNPFGLGGSVTTGIISARGRHIGQGPYDDFFQTDAAINPGNSGGPLFNLKGEIIGINTAILSRSGGNQGIGFSIPSNIVKNITQQIKEHGRPIRGWLGVRIQKVDKDMAKALGLDEAKGALVADVEPDSPAESAGLKVGDLILEFDGQAVADMTDLPKMVAQTKIGTKSNLSVLRDGKNINLRATIAELDEESQAQPSLKTEKFENDLGLQLSDLNNTSRQRYGIDKNLEGAVVVNVAPGSGAQASGIRAGDVIVRVGQKSVSSAREAYGELSKIIKKDEEETVLLLVNRQGSNLFVPVRVLKSDG